MRFPQGYAQILQILRSGNSSSDITIRLLTSIDTAVNQNNQFFRLPYSFKQSLDSAFTLTFPKRIQISVGIRNVNLSYMYIYFSKVSYLV